jgi:hypothetical protein
MTILLERKERTTATQSKDLFLVGTIYGERNGQVIIVRLNTKRKK